MSIRLLTALNLSVLTVVLAAGVNVEPGYAAPQDSSAATTATEDVVHMRDGRVLRGKILNETRNDIEFEYRDPNLRITTRMTLAKEHIMKIERGVPVEDAANVEPAEESDEDIPSSPQPRPTADVRVVDMQRDYGISRIQSADANVPSLYVVPLRGQMGTDVRASVYEEVVKDIRLHKPTVVVLDVNCADTSELMFPEGYAQESKQSLERKRLLERGLVDYDEYRVLVSLFRDQLRDVPQVVWIHDSDGVSATVVMAWDQIYMAPGARLGSKVSVLDITGANRWRDPDVRAKMIAAWLGAAKSIVERGGYSGALADAMLTKEAKLSGRWRGREVIWSLDDSGDYVVDDSDEDTATFNAKTAEDLCIAKGTAETLDDLALLLGYREYRVIEGRQFDLINGYINSWRRAFEECKDSLRDHQTHMGRVRGENAVRWLSRAIKDLENILKRMEQYKAVEIRMENDYGLSTVALKIQIERLKEDLRQLTQNGRNPGGGRSGGGGRRMGGGGGGAS